MTRPAGITYLDAQSIIYTIERNPTYRQPLRSFWAAQAARACTLVTSELAFMECLVVPLRRKNDAVVKRFERLFRSRHLDVHPVTRSHLRRAAELRATHSKLRTPDAIHLATALAAGCGTFVTNDKSLRTLPGISVVILDDLLTP